MSSVWNPPQCHLSWRWAVWPELTGRRSRGHFISKNHLAKFLHFNKVPFDGGGVGKRGKGQGWAGVRQW